MNCAERIAKQWDSRKEDLTVLYGDSSAEDRLKWAIDNGYADAGDPEDVVSSTLCDASFEYGLCREFETRNPLNCYWRYLLSTGGPHEEIRIYLREDDRGMIEMVGASFILKDWGDVAEIDISKESVTLTLYYDLITTVGPWDHIRFHSTP